jgi:hypothetical protein
MRAIIIDPTDKSVTEADIDTSYEAFRSFSRSGYIERVRLPEGHWLWIDEEGLLQPEPGPFFRMEAVPSATFAGKGIILCCDEEGDHAPATVSEELIRENVWFPSVRFTGFTDWEGTEEHPILGSVAVFRRTANFEEISE